MKHHCFQIQTPTGLQAKIHGDPNMQPETREALAELIDAAANMRGISPTVREGSSTTRLSNTCPYCRSHELEPREIAGVAWIHCNLCQSDFDPLDNSLAVAKSEALVRRVDNPEVKR